MLLGRQYFPEDVLGMVLLLLLLAFALPALRSPAHQHRRRVFHKRTLFAQHPLSVTSILYFILYRFKRSHFSNMKAQQPTQRAKTQQRLCYYLFDTCESILELNFDDLCYEDNFVGQVRDEKSRGMGKKVIVEGDREQKIKKQARRFFQKRRDDVDKRMNYMNLGCGKRVVKYIYYSKQNSAYYQQIQDLLRGMFNLCKTVKIYQTINHYHISDQTFPHSVDSHELKYEDSLPTHSHHLAPSLALQEPRRSLPRRQGISLSIKRDGDSPSPRKECSSKCTGELLSASKSNSSEIASLKLRSTKREDFDSPKIFESKITWGEMSPRISSYQKQPILLPSNDSDLFGLDEIPLRKESTRTTQTTLPQDSYHQRQKNEAEFSPLKRSSSFLRSSGKSKIQDSMKNSLEFSLRNTLEYKLSSSKLRREEQSESLLKLSCSSYSQIPEPRVPHYQLDQFSQTSSLQLKQEQSFLQDYANEVSRSITIEPSQQKEMKYARSNLDLIKLGNQEEFKPTQSNILQRQDSPVRRLKNKYGGSLLNIYDKETIVSKSNTSRSLLGVEVVEIIDESIIIRRDLSDSGASDLQNLA